MPFFNFISPAPTCSFQYNVNDGTNRTTYNFTLATFGAAEDTRRVFAMIHYGAGSGGFSVNSVTINGVAATIHVDLGVGTANFRGIAIASAIVPTGTTGTVAVTFSGSVGRCGIGIWSAYGLKNSSPTDVQSTPTQPLSFSVNKPNSGIIIAGWSALVTASGNITWDTLTERYEQNDETTTQEGGADFSGAYPANSAFFITADVLNKNGTASTAAAITWI